MAGALLSTPAIGCTPVGPAGTGELIIADGLCPRIAELLPGALHELVSLERSADPLADISNVLAERRLLGQPVGTLHVVAHGRAGAFQIGGQWITAASLVGHADQLAQWHVGRIALWSCEVGADADFVALLEELSGARVHASERILGRTTNAEIANWQLTRHTLTTPADQALTITAPFSTATLQSWQHSLVTATFSGIFACTRSYDPSTFFGEETSKVDINTSPLSITSVSFSQSGAQFTGNNVNGTVSYVDSLGQTVTFTGLASRPIKVGGVLKGFYVWVDNPPTGSGGSAADVAFIISIDNAYFQANTAISSSSDPVSKALNSLVATQSSGITIDNPIADESATWIVFTVTNNASSSRTLGTVAAELSDGGANGLTAEAADFTGAFVYEYSTDSGSTWSSTKPASIAAGASIKIRVGTIFDDTLVEVDEYMGLNVNVSWPNPGGGSAMVSGIGTIVDNDAPFVPTLSVDNILVNEASPYAVFTVTGAPGQNVTLALQNDDDPNTNDALIGVDTGTQLQYFNGTTWVDYNPGSPVPINPNGELLVRVAIINDDVYEGPETFQLAVTPVGGTTSYGTATILDDGSGNIYPDNTTGNTDPDAVKDDDRAVKVDNILVNEASPYAVFTVTGAPGQNVTLALQNDDDPNTNDALIGVDTGTQLQYFNGTTWVDYNPGSPVPINPNGELLVRVAIINDDVYEGPETFQLAVTPVGGTTSYGTATILDDGSGNIYPDNTTGNTDPDAVKDDDRAVKVDNILVNEASPYAVFTVTGAPGQNVTLALQNDDDPNTNDALIGVDTGTQLQYFNGTTWVDYNPGSPVPINPNGELLVRVAIINDDVYEGPETFQLAVTPVGGTTSYGTATILDDGSGNIYPDNTTGNTDPDAVKDDDRAVKVDNILVNEASPYAVFTVTGAPGQNVTLALQNDDDPNTNDALIGVDTGTQLQYFNGTTWVDYNPGSPVPINPNGELLVRVAIINDDVYEGPETFQLAVTPVGGTTSYGTATILDDGSGNIYPDNTTGNTDPDAVKDDDRAVKVDNILVNEASPYAVFTVTGAPGQNVTLALQNDDDPNTNDALIGVDTGTQLQYFNGTTWVDYNPGSPVPINPNGELLVRVAIINDDVYEGPETFQLAVTPVGGTTSYGTATILDDGSGNIYPDNTTGNTDPDAVKDDDRAVGVTGTNVNEASPYVQWTVSGAAGQLVFLALAGTGSNPATPGIDTGTTLQVLINGAWVNYDPTNPPAIPAGGELLVRVNVIQDDLHEGTESLNLVATNTGGTAYAGTSTINDEGQGDIFLPDNTTGVPNQPGDPGYPAQLDDDRPLGVTGTNVNEASPYVQWTVSGAAGQLVFLALAGTGSNPATPGIDTGTTLQVLINGAWVNYDPTNPPAIPAGGELLVRVNVIQDDLHEGTESLNLVATNTGGTAYAGTSTINDEGQGDIFLPDNITATPNRPGDPGYPAQLDDDRRPQAVKMQTDTDSADATNLVTANGKPQLQLIGPAGRADSLSLKGAKGELLIPGQNYTVREVALTDKPGQSVYLIDLIDADLSKPGKQSFGNYYQGQSTRNAANNGDGIYTILFNGEPVDTFEIRTQPLSQAKRISCLNKIYKGDRGLESTLYGYRTNKSKGTNGDDNLNGTNNTSDSLNGKKGSDVLNGVGDRLTGNSFSNAITNQVDTLIGGKGADYFQCGDIAGSFYVGSGANDYARIKDFEKKDKLILHGAASDYTQSIVSSNQVDLYLNGDLIASIQGKGASSLDLNDRSQVSYL